jgi:hypothetical protein
MAAVESSTSRPTEASGHDGTIVVWRTWLLRQEEHPADPILTGLHGFRWPNAEMDAKCIVQDAVSNAANPSRTKIDRHHRVIPDPDCSCGIYAGADELSAARDPLPPRSVPFAAGFVSLTGRILSDGRMLRAQHATIIGPLSLALGRRPRWHRLAPGATNSLTPRITTDRNSYRTLWTKRRVGEAATPWLERTAQALTSRYECVVEIAAAG